MGLGARKVHDVESVNRLVPSVDVSLEHDHMLPIELFGKLWIEVMVERDVVKVSIEKTLPHYNEVLEHELGGLGAKDTVKGGEAPILCLDVVNNLFHLRCSKLFVECFGAKKVEFEESSQDFPTRADVCFVGFTKVFREKRGSFSDGDVGVNFVQR